MKKSKAAFLLLSSATLAISTSSCGVIPGTSMERIELTNIGLKVEKYGENAGVKNAEIIEPGRTVWYNGYTEDVLQFPIVSKPYPFVQSSTEGSTEDESIKVPLSGSPVELDVTVNYAFNRERIKDAYEKYRMEGDSFTNSIVRNAVRKCAIQVASASNITPVNLSTSLVNFSANWQKCVQSQIPEITISDLSIINKPRVDPKLQASIDESFAATQKAETAKALKEQAVAEGSTALSKAQAEAAIKVTQAEAEARANRIKAGSITP